MKNPPLPSQIHAFLASQTLAGNVAIQASAIAAALGAARATVNRHLATMVSKGLIIQQGAGRSIRYRLPPDRIQIAPVQDFDKIVAAPEVLSALSWTSASDTLRTKLKAPIGTRTPVTYLRKFVDDYIPNHSSLMPPALAATLLAAGRTHGQQPASTYARKVLEQLLIDLSWHSSRLEGNLKSLLDTRALFAKGRSADDDEDSSMLLNHKDAIEFMVQAVPEYGITVPVVRNIQGLLMQGLLENPDSVGAIRKSVVNITDSVYIPTQVPALLEEMLTIIVSKARSIKNPIEAAFFLWLNIAYLQPFEDGNKRTSRLCANLPLLLSNCAPLSFLDVEREDYALSVMGIYESLEVAMAVDLFEWTYRRSITKYKAVLQSLGAPDQFRAKYRNQLGEAIRYVVQDGKNVETAIASLLLPAKDQASFLGLLRRELVQLEPFNCARYRLNITLTEHWIGKNRPM